MAISFVDQFFHIFPDHFRSFLLFPVSLIDLDFSLPDVSSQLLPLEHHSEKRLAVIQYMGKFCFRSLISLKFFPKVLSATVPDLPAAVRKSDPLLFALWRPW